MGYKLVAFSAIPTACVLRWYPFRLLLSSGGFCRYQRQIWTCHEAKSFKDVMHAKVFSCMSSSTLLMFDIWRFDTSPVSKGCMLCILLFSVGVFQSLDMWDTSEHLTTHNRYYHSSQTSFFALFRSNLPRHRIAGSLVVSHCWWAVELRCVQKNVSRARGTKSQISLWVLCPQVLISFHHVAHSFENGAVQRPLLHPTWC